MQIWAKFNANERMASIGAGLVVLAFVLGLVLSSGYLGLGGTGVLSLLGAIALIAIYYLKYTNTTINWPAPIPVIAFAIGAIMGIFALLSLLQIVQWMGVLSFIATWLLAPIVAIVGSAMMAWFTYREWQASKTAAS